MDIAPWHIATWNVNGIRARLPVVLTWLKEARPDLVCLQEIKAEDRVFPREEIEDLGYTLTLYGQKGFNGVAILSKGPLEDVERGFFGFDDPQARFLQGVWRSPGGRMIRIASLYLPNGNPVGTEKYLYKLSFMHALLEHAKKLLRHEEPVILAGDYNVIAQSLDAANPDRWVGDALFEPEVRTLFHQLLHLGFYDSFRLFHPFTPGYTFWDYQGRSRERNQGIRIDHLLLSPQAMDLASQVHVHDVVRDGPSPSDHVPVVVTFKEKEKTSHV